MIQRFDTGLMIRLSILAAVALFLPGCGRKAPPVPPPKVPPPAVKDLSWQMQADVINLTWSIPKSAVSRPRKLKGVRVYRSKEPLSDAVCPDCPKRFKQVADIAVIEWNGTSRDENAVMTYSERLDKGYRFIYKVVVHNRAGRIGRDSNWVEITF